jgi:hypothetical protein
MSAEVFLAARVHHAFARRGGYGVRVALPMPEIGFISARSLKTSKLDRQWGRAIGDRNFLSGPR